jgi:26S proteasome regulatory subunit N9
VKELNDDQESLNYLTSLQEELTTREELDKEQALLFIKIEVARFKLRLGESLESRDLLDNIDEELSKLDSIELKLNQSYYSTNAEYYKLKSDYNNFYYQSLLFLSTIRIGELESIEQQKLSYELSIAALLGDKIYNFGELLSHPILKSLQDASNPYNWLVELLNSLNSGNISDFSKLLSNLNKVPILQNSESFLRQKICLMTLVELVFSQTIRIISFEDVAKATLLNTDEVEHLVMRALSLGLLKGSIDQINQLITINWVQPRIINQKQIEQMKTKLIQWDSNVSKLGEFMEANGKELWIQ